MKVAQDKAAPTRNEGLWRTFSWSAQRLSDRASTIERVTEFMGIPVIGLFIVCAFATAMAGHGAGWVALWLAAALVFIWLVLAGPMQFRHRARLRRRLRETGVRAKGLITDIWVLEAGSGICAMLRYTLRTQDGETRTYVAFDETSIVLRRRVGDPIVVLYDPNQPHVAIVEEN